MQNIYFIFTWAHSFPIIMYNLTKSISKLDEENSNFTEGLL